MQQTPERTKGGKKKKVLEFMQQGASTAGTVREGTLSWILMAVEKTQQPRDEPKWGGGCDKTLDTT